MIIVDSHCHLDLLEKYDTIDNIVKCANEHGIKYLQTICTKLSDFEKILNIAKKYDNVFASVGVHPSEVREIVESSHLVALSSNEKVIGLGETGLDYFYNTAPEQQKLQRECFDQHIFASQENKLPVIVHMRDAEQDTIEIISSNKKFKDFPAIIHCFTASREFAAEMLDMGVYISISGIITFKNATALQEVVKYIPVERILIETDSPYLTPVPNRGKPNQPAYTKYVLECVAALKGIEIEKLANITTDNFFKLFTKAQNTVTDMGN